MSIAKDVVLLAINPGSTSTKLCVFAGEKEVFRHTIKHSTEELAAFPKIIDQLAYRTGLILSALEEGGYRAADFHAIVARGGNMKPVVGGTYLVNEAMVEDLRVGVMGQHASNLGGIIAQSLAEPQNIDAYVVDPVIVDELEPLARISGMPEIPRKSKDHPLNQKAVARRAAKDMGGEYPDFNFIIAHMGGGISVGVHKQGRIVDVNNCLDGDGPMSPERSGGIPFGSLIDLCFSGEFTKEQIRKKLVGGGGLAGYLGTNNGLEIVARIQKGDEKAHLVYEAMAYQVSKEIGAGATVLEGKVDAILLTGGLAWDDLLVDWIRQRTEFIAPVRVYPGEFEMEAMAEGVLRVLRGEEEAKPYPNVPVQSSKSAS